MPQPTHPRALLAAWGLHPKKRLGQNFLIDTGAAHRIAQLALLDAPATTRVIEIGAGTGALTDALLDAGADLTTIEIDPDLITLLRNREDLARATIVEADALAFDFVEYATHGTWRVAGNLPYNVATPLVTQLVEMERGPQTITVMMQKDVVDRLAAQPGTPAYGSLTIAVQNTMRVRRALTLGPRSFYPAPKVDSTVVQLVRRDVPLVQPNDTATFRRVVRAAFAYRRKTLVNSLVLALGLERAVIESAIDVARLPAQTRGEQLDLAAFARLADALTSREKEGGVGTLA